EAIMKHGEFSNFKIIPEDTKLIFSLNIPSFAKLLSGIRSNNKLLLKITKTENTIDPIYKIHIDIMDKNSVIIETNTIMIKIEDEDQEVVLTDESWYCKHPVNIESTFLKSIKKLKSSKK